MWYTGTTCCRLPTGERQRMSGPPADWGLAGLSWTSAVSPQSGGIILLLEKVAPGGGRSGVSSKTVAGLAGGLQGSEHRGSLHWYADATGINQTYNDLPDPVETFAGPCRSPIE